MERTSRDSEIKEEEDVQAGVEIWKYVLGFTGIAVVKCAIELGIAEAIENHEGPMALSELSSTLGCVPFSLDRIMRFLVHHHFFKEGPTIQGTAGYVHTPLSRRLLRQGEDSMADYILLESSPVMLAPWHHLSSRVRVNGTAAFEAAYGGDIWKHAAANPAFNRLINDAMACDARLAVSAIIESCPKLFDNGLKTLVDVGGGNGTALGKFVKAFPWIEGINFDLPHVVSVAAKCEGVKQVGGDMFDSVPKADAVFIMKVLQDWNNDDCVRILKKCKEAIPKDKGKVIIVETVIGEEKQDSFEFVRLMKDMAMMAFTNSGKERTSEEWDCVLKEAGFSSYNIKPIRAVQSVIEAFP